MHIPDPGDMVGAAVSALLMLVLAEGVIWDMSRGGSPWLCRLFALTFAVLSFLLVWVLAIRWS